MSTFLKSLVTLFLVYSISQISSYSQSAVNEHSIKFQNNQIATLVGEDGVIMKTTDAGITWADQTSGVTNALLGNVNIDNNTSLAVGENGIIVKTTDSGNSWNVISSGVTDHLRDIETISSTELVAIGDNGTIIRTTDAGNTWEKLTVPSVSNLNDIVKLNLNILYTVGDNSTVLRSDDAGITWTLIPFSSGSFYNFKSIGGQDESNLILIGDGYTIIRTTNQGNTWLGIGTNPGTTNLHGVLFFSANEAVIVGDDGFMLNTTDGGLSWSASTMQIANVPRDLMAVSFSSATDGITVGENGVHYYTIDGGKTWTDMTPTTKALTPVSKYAIKEVLNQNYPNPFNPSTVISYSLPNDANVTLKVYDMTGREVSNLVNSFQKAGSYNTTFNASSLSSGVYFYKLTVASGINHTEKTMRMILTK